eukprot:m.71889 g.71889  ORF g.71889 m.71889 type:complete len:383 (+) comp12284_c0_seq1:100-1248(+)
MATPLKLDFDDTTGEAPALKKSKKEIRVWVDGCYDMMHYGHANSLRQAKKMGTTLVVGVHSDAEITRVKGPPLMNEEERYAAVRACKWADEVVTDVPYTTTVETLDKYNCDFCVHGDDLTTDENGVDSYRFIKEVNRFKVCKRTAGISTTDLVGRLLLRRRGDDPVTNEQKQQRTKEFSESPCVTKVSSFLPSTRKILQFIEGSRERKKSDKCVYIDGGFDIFHIGHISALKKASELGDYVICGIHSDETMAEHFDQPTVCTLHERTLGALQCKYVNEVVMDAPPIVTQELIDHFQIDVVCHGKQEYHLKDGANPYAVPIKLGIFKQIDSLNNVTTGVIIDRILSKQSVYAERNKKKIAKDKRALDAAIRRASQDNLNKKAE